jgi:hypothetical protein
MPAVGFDTFFPKKVDTVFIVENVTKGTPQEKTIHIFTYPIPPGKQRDILQIPFVSEADIRHSLLKGELRVKADCGEIRVVRCTIDLLQFDPEQRAWLSSIGVCECCMTIVIGPQDMPFVFKQQIELIGVKNSSNRTFTTPDKFINGTFGNNDFRILIRHNGRDLVEGIDYSVSESGGPGTGYDTITLTFSPKKRSVLVADYVVAATTI